MSSGRRAAQVRLADRVLRRTSGGKTTSLCMDHAGDIAVKPDLTMPSQRIAEVCNFSDPRLRTPGTPASCVSESPSRVIRRRQRALTDIGRQIRRSALCHMKCYEVKQSAPRARSLFQIKHMHRASRWVSAVISYTRRGRSERLWDDPQNHGIIGFATLAAMASTIDSRYKPDAVHTDSQTS